MATHKQIQANRRNALKSTGPRSAEGKAASRFNALKTGIAAQSLVIPGEDPDELDALATEYHGQFQPATALERFLVDALVYADWQLRRLRRIDAQLWHKEIANARASSFRQLDEDAPLADIFDRGPSSWMLLQRRIDSTERSYYRALTQLQRLQSRASRVPDPGPQAPDPRPPAPGPQPLEEIAHSANLASFCNIPPRTCVGPAVHSSPEDARMHHHRAGDALGSQRGVQRPGDPTGGRVDCPTSRFVNDPRSGLSVKPTLSSVEQ